MLENLGKLQEVSSLCFWVRENFLTSLFVWTIEMFFLEKQENQEHTILGVFFFFTQVTQEITINACVISHIANLPQPLNWKGF